MNDRVAGMTTVVAMLSPAPVVYLHVAIFLETGVILSDGCFRLVSFKGQESVSDHFEYELELHGNSDPDNGSELDFNDLLGRPVTVGIHYPALDGHEQPDREEVNKWFDQSVHGKDQSARLSLFNGIVATFSMEQPGVYRATMRPALWKLTLTNNYCIHRQLNVRDAIAGVLHKHNVDFSVASLVGSGNLAVARQQDWLQAGETDYDFVYRLMSKAHIYYFYLNTGTSHTVVFANRPVYPEAMPDGKPLRYCGTQADELGLSQPDIISDYRFQQSLASSAVNLVFTREEAAWEADAVAGFQSFHAQTKPAPGPLPFNQYQIYQYGCSDVEVDHYAYSTQDILDSGRQQLSGSSYCPYLHCGHRFSVTQESRSEQWPLQVRSQLEGRSFVATQVQHEANLDGSYSNKFQASDASGLVTPFSIQETQQGSVLASVVSGGHQGVPPVGWRYMQKDNFDPGSSRILDSEGISPVLEGKGVYVRFSTGQDIFSPDGAESDEPVWVKLASHMQTVPEIGTTVMISRAQDQSELPEIQSIIQANGTKVIMPSGWTANTNVGSSYSTGYGDGKSIRFGLHSDANLDKAVAIVNQKYDTGKFRESSYSQGATYGYSTSENGADGLLSQSDSFGSTFSTHKGSESWSSTEFGTTTNHSLVVGDVTNTSKTDGTTSNTTSQNIVFNNSTTNSQTSESFTVSSVNLDVTGQHLSTSAVGISVSTSATGVRLSGSMEGMTSSSSMIGLSQNDSVVGVSIQTSATGSSSNVAVTGTSEHVSMTTTDIGTNLVGVSSSTSLTGASSTMNLVGDHNDVSLTGTSNRVSLTGQSSSISVQGSSSDISLSGDTTTISMKGASTSIDMTGGGIQLQLTGLQSTMQMAGMSVTITELKIYI